MKILALVLLLATNAPAALLAPKAALTGRALMLSLNQSAAPVALATGIKGLLKSAGQVISPPILPAAFETEAGSYFYHGTSMETLANVVFDGGAMKKDVSYFSNEAGFPFGYARSRARVTRSPGVVLQFKGEEVAPKVGRGHYQPTVAHDKVPGIYQLAEFSVAKEPISLSSLTGASKKGVLAWLEKRRELDPANPAWDKLLDAFRAAFGA